MKIGVVTVTYNSGNVLVPFLECLQNQTEPNFITIVVDNASHDRTRQILAENRECVVLYNDTNLGVAKANNQGISAAIGSGCDWVLLLNNDTLFDPDFIQNLITSTDKYNAEIISPLILADSPPNTVWYAGGGFSELRGMLTFHSGFGKEVSEFMTNAFITDYASTCALLVKKDVFEKIGMMNEEYFVYFDDSDFAFRAKKQGINYWVDPSVRLIHKASSLTGGPTSQFTVKWMSRNWIVFLLINMTFLRNLYNFTYIACYAIGRLLVRKDSFSIFALRIRSYFEGFSQGFNYLKSQTRDRNEA